MHEKASAPVKFSKLQHFECEKVLIEMMVFFNARKKHKSHKINQILDFTREVWEV